MSREAKACFLGLSWETVSCTSSGKFLRVEGCYPESFGFLRLWVTIHVSRSISIEKLFKIRLVSSSQPESHHHCLNNRSERMNDQGQTMIGSGSDESDLFQNCTMIMKGGGISELTCMIVATYLTEILISQFWEKAAPFSEEKLYIPQNIVFSQFWVIFTFLDKGSEQKVLEDMS